MLTFSSTNYTQSLDSYFMKMSYTMTRLTHRDIYLHHRMNICPLHWRWLILFHNPHNRLIRTYFQWHWSSLKISNLFFPHTPKFLNTHIETRWESAKFSTLLTHLLGVDGPFLLTFLSLYQYFCFFLAVLFVFCPLFLSQLLFISHHIPSFSRTSLNYEIKQ